MKLMTYASGAALAEGVAGALADDLRAALEHGPASLALPGGTTPAPVFDVLSGADLDWSRVTLLPGDERWVPSDHPRSNAALIRRHLLRGRAAAARLIDLYIGDADAADAEAALALTLAPHLPLSVLLLGMGADLHTASLFPQAPHLALALSDDAPPVMAMQGGDPPEARISLTLPVLRQAGARHLLIQGAAKRVALEGAQGRDPMQAPIAALLDDIIVHWAE